MAGGCRLHSHSRTTGQHALSSGENVSMRMSELKEAKIPVQSLVLRDGSSANRPAQMLMSQEHLVTVEVLEE